MKAPRILFVMEGAIATTLIIEALLRSMPEAFEPAMIHLNNLRPHHLENNVLVFCRVCRPDFMWLPAYLAARDIPYGYYTDDNFWELNDGSQVAQHYQAPAVRACLDAFVSGARLILLNSRFLQSYLKKKFASPMIVETNGFFDTSLLARPVTVDKSPRLRIGYAGGARPREFSMLVPALERILETYPDKVELEFIGWAPEELRRWSGVKLLPGETSYEKFIDLKRSRGWDIGLSPLLYSVFSASKTNNKYREFAGCGIATVYSDVPPYNDSVVDGETGLLADNTPEAWRATIERLILDADLRARISRQGQEDIVRNYSLEKVVHAWHGALLPLVAAWRPTRLSFNDRIQFRKMEWGHTHNYFRERLVANYREIGLWRTLFKIMRRLLRR